MKKVSICIGMHQAVEAYLREKRFNVAVLDAYRGEDVTLEATIQGTDEEIQRLLKQLDQEEILATWDTSER